MSRRPRSLTIVTPTAFLAAATLVLVPGEASGQRGGRGTMSVPRVTTAPSRPTTTSPARPTRPSGGSGRGYMTPGSSSGGVTGGYARRGDLPRISMQPSRRGSDRAYARTYDRDYGTSTYWNGGSRYFRSSARRGGGCVYGCTVFRAGVRIGRFAGSFAIGYPVFAIPVFVPYYYHEHDVVYDRYHDVDAVDDVDDRYVADSRRPASKLIVVGGGTGGGRDALTVESLADSVRLSWLANGRAAREVKLFVTDSARRELATRTANPSAPTATFEIATLSAPVAFAGVTVVFADGVTSTTLVPYRGEAAPGRQR